MSAGQNPNHKYGSEYVVQQLAVSGLVQTPLLLNVADLEKLPSIEILNLTMFTGSQQKKKVVGSYRGVLLLDLLNLAEVVLVDHHASNRLYLKLTSNDGYLSVLSLHEVTNSVVGEKAIVAYERDGKRLDEDEGNFVFVSANDFRPGPRRMRYLKNIEVCEAV